MNLKRDRCLKCDGNFEANNKHCSTSNEKKKDMIQISAKQSESSYVMQIVSIGIKSDKVYEAKILLAPEVDMSSVKITVKGNNLRVTAKRPQSNNLANKLLGLEEKYSFGDLIKGPTKHCENLRIPETIDNDQIRAIVHSKHRILILTAPTLKFNKLKNQLQ